MSSLADPVIGTPGTGLPEVLTLERIEDDLFRTVVVSREPAGLFGGQVTAQALRAAAQTVPEGGTRTRCTATSSAGATPRAGCC